MEQLLSYFIPESYKLDLNIDKNQKTLGGIVTIVGAAKNSTPKFHAVGFCVDIVKINGKKAAFKQENGLLTLVDAPMARQTIEIVYHGSLNENMQGAYLSTYEYNGKTEKIVSTQFESHYAREAFPCIDEPAAKATFDLSITLPEGSDDLIIANTPILEKKGNMAIFTTTPRMSTYLLAFVIGKFNSKSLTNNHGVKITTYAPLNQSIDSVDFANEIAARSLEYYDEQFGIPYPLEKLDQVAIPDFEAGAMENWGLVTYREACLLADKNSSLDTKKSVALTVAHELSHQWFGDLVTMKWWDDLWLNESFASVMEYYAVDHIHPEYNIWEDFITSDCLAALKRDAYQGVQSVFQPVESPAEIATLFDGAIVYAKGARLMRMLIRLMGEEKFLAGIRDYFRKFSYSNTCGDDLWNSLAPYADFDVKTFMHTWISQPGYPVITSDQQKRFLLDESEDKTLWPLPEISDDMSGHYLINLSDEEFVKKLNSFADLSLEQRLRLLIDRMFLAKTPLVASDSLLDLLGEFKDETSASVWEIMGSIIAHLKLFVEPETELDNKFRHYVHELIESQITRLGINPKTDDDDNDTRLRAQILGLDFYANDEERLKALAAEYDDDFSKINPEIRHDVFDAVIRLDESNFDKFLTKYQQTSDPEIKSELLYSLCLAKSDENVDKLIDLLGRPEIVKPQDHMYLFIYLRRNYKASEKALDWLFNNWEYVEKMTGEKSLEDYPRYAANTIKTAKEAKKFFDFFDQYQDNPALSRALIIAKTEIDSRIKLIDTDMDGIADYFRIAR